MYAIRRKSDKLFYNSSTWKWVELEKARIFKKTGDITAFLTYNMGPYYIGEDKKGQKGLFSIIPIQEEFGIKKSSKTIIPKKDFEIVEIELKVKE